MTLNRTPSPRPGSLDKPVDVQEFINSHPFSRYQWIVFALCFVIVLLDGFDTAAIGFIAPSLLDEWGIKRSALGPLLSAALFGLAFGALAAGPLADRWGRRMLLVAATGLFGVASVLCGFAGNLTELTALRFVTGVGLGAAMPSAVTLMSEFCPDSRRATITNLMFCGFPLGAALGGFLAAWMIPNFGWRSVLLLGGSIPLALLLPLIVFLPESVRYLATTGRPVAQIISVLQRISGSALSASTFRLRETVIRKADTKFGIGLVLSQRYLLGTVMLWIAYFMGLVIFYALINWMPILFKEAGLTAQRATLLSALFPLGGVGAVLLGFLMDRFNPTRVVAAGFGLTAVAVWAVGLSIGNTVALVSSVFLAGVLMNTSQSSLPALAASFYPTAGRATGVAWMLGIGRFGGIAGSLLIAELNRRSFDFAEIFGIVAIAGLISASALVVKLVATGQSDSSSAPSIAPLH